MADVAPNPIEPHADSIEKPADEAGAGTGAANDTKTVPSDTAAAEPKPCRTLYLRDLDEKRKVKKLRELLHAFFSPYGEVEWIYASRAVRLRGQAFVTFRDLESATTAMRKLQGVTFLDRKLQIQYARSVTLRPQGKKAKDAKDTKVPRPPPGEAPPKPKRQKTSKLPPNRILFAEKVPTSPPGVLGERCARFSGFVECRSVPGKPDIAFVEFTTEAHAAVALGALNGMVIVEGSEALVLSYAKK